MKNANIQSMIALISFVCLIALIWYSVHYSWYWILISYIFYKTVVGLLGNQIAQHRYFSHRSFQTSAKKEWLLYFASLTTGMNPVFYALAHRHHHRYSDQPQDLHSVHNRWTDIFSPVTKKTSYSGEVEITRVLSSRLRKINNYWSWIFLFYIIVSAAIDWRLAAFVTLTGPAWNYIHMIVFRVWLAHWKIPGSYRNFDTDDYSYNHQWIHWFDLGEGLHNNHHRYPNRFDQAVKMSEFDFAGCVVRKFFI
jgi:stearoyl-CoA desaturase (delta-9 desaturase)